MRLTRDTYFSPEMNEKYMGHSQFLDFKRCGVAAIRKIHEEAIPSTAMMQGQAFDAFFEGGENALWEYFRNHGMIKRDGSANADAETVRRAISKAQESPLWMELATGKQQVIKTGSIGGIKFKIMIDSYHPGKYIVDRKLVRDFDPIWSDYDGERVSFVRAWGYDYQAAIYQAVEGKKLPFVIAAVTKEADPDIALIQVPQYLIDQRREEIEYFAPIYDSVKRGIVPPTECGKCEHCRRERIADHIRDLSEFEPGGGIV